MAVRQAVLGRRDWSRLAMQQNLVSERGLDPKQAGGEIKDHDKTAAAVLVSYRAKGRR